MFESLNQYQFLLAALNLIVLYVILKKILFKPVTEFMEKRTKSIESSIEEAKRKLSEAEELHRAYEEQLRLAKADAKGIVDDATRQAGHTAQQIIDEAKKQAGDLLKQARAEMEEEHRRMLLAVRSEVAGLALAAAARVVQANMNTAGNRALVDQFLKETGEA